MPNSLIRARPEQDHEVHDTRVLCMPRQRLGLAKAQVLHEGPPQRMQIGQRCKRCREACNRATGAELEVQGSRLAYVFA